MKSVSAARTTMRLTTHRWGLERAEAMTTSAAFVLSTVLYLHYGHAYLARGVLGDLVGFGLLTAVLAVRRCRLRHEALACFVAILVVLRLDPQWPLRASSATWWLVFAVAMSGFLLLRRALLPA
jgi:hypothetical protein